MARWTLAQYEALKAAVAEGALEVEYDGRRVRYQSFAQMMQLLASMEKDLGLVQSDQRDELAQHSKGLG